ncbi:MAG: sugar ABC transporter permease [Dehalococcoidia bacterium]|nr:MAG: sugar ABC transporter permease [Dehalococcoidia bacterium]
MNAALEPIPRRRIVWRREARRFAAASPFVLPSIVLFAVFVFYPLARSVYLGFHATDPFGRREVWVGIDQYRDVLTSSDFRHSLLVTGQFALYTVIGSTAVGLYLALLVHRRLPGILFFRTVYTSTVASSVAVSSVMWLLLLNPGVGVLNYITSKGSIPAANWLTDPKWALVSIAMTTVWMNVGLATIVILAGLQNIPEELYESARVDGARPWDQFIHVTLPALSPTLLFVSVVGVIFAFESFGQIDILTKGGPLDSTTVIVYSIYREAFLHYNVGLASAQAVVLFVIVLLLTGLQFLAAQRWVFYR